MINSSLTTAGSHKQPLMDLPKGSLSFTVVPGARLIIFITSYALLFY